MTLAYFPRLTREIALEAVINESVIGSHSIPLPSSLVQSRVINTSSFGAQNVRKGKHYVSPARVVNVSSITNKAIQIDNALITTRVVNTNHFGTGTVRKSKHYLSPTRAANTSIFGDNEVLPISAAVLALDGAPVVNQGTSGATSVAVTLSTTMTDDIVVLFVSLENSPAAVPTVLSISDTAGLTWHKRASQDQASSPNRIEIWWAHAPSILTGDVITVTTDFFDDSTLTAQAINGANATSPWDTNASLPVKASASNGGPGITGLSTTAATTFVFGFAGNAQSPAFNGTPPSGFAMIAAPRNSGRANWSNAAIEYQAFSGPQTNISVTLGGMIAVDWTFIADAIRQA